MICILLRSEYISYQHLLSLKEENHPRQIKAQPLPDFSNVFKPELSHSSTHSQPFSFEHRDKELKQRKEEKIKTVLEEEMKVSQFRAELTASKPISSFH